MDVLNGKKDYTMADRDELSDKEVEELKSRGIDFSDIPELTPDYLETLQRVVPRDYYKVVPVKKAISIKLDADVLEYFKAKGKGYQTRINKVLRQEMLRETAPSYGKENLSSKREEDS
ncbi:BrnA antitoxin family protein [uncultured Sphaerochaeta sp.]|uniref:BrnA antitoxin family protein n=1 Tax=uncultured Sphaerochaeta sp. TaxID=886478 RepID=UPI003749DE15